MILKLHKIGFELKRIHIINHLVDSPIGGDGGNIYYLGASRSLVTFATLVTRTVPPLVSVPSKIIILRLKKVKHEVAFNITINIPLVFKVNVLCLNS